MSGVRLADLPPVAVLDMETCSTEDLRRAGAVRYAQHPDTQVILYSFQILRVTSRDRQGRLLWSSDTEDPVLVLGSALHEDLRSVISAGGVMVAHNAMFELVVWKWILAARHGWPAPPALSRWRDTMAQAAHAGLPLSLEQACMAAGLSVLKDRAGHDLMLRMARPRVREFDGYCRWWHVEDLAKTQQLGAYCQQDVRAEVALMKALPSLPQREQAVWRVTTKANLVGVGVDLELVAAGRKLAELAKQQLDSHMSALTSRAVLSCSAVGDLFAWVNRQLAAGHHEQMPDLAKATVAHWLKDPDLPPPVRCALDLRQKAARTSTAKLAALQNSVSDGDVICGLLAYYGAFRTGRWAGRLVQVQNFPRPVRGLDVDAMVKLILAGCDLEELRLFTRVPAMDVLMSCLRACLVPPMNLGTWLVVADASAIEARILPWLAGQGWTLDLFERRKDVYVAVAAALGSSDRQFGKMAQLSLGFQTGAKKLRTTALDVYGIELTEQQAVDTVTSWRDTNRDVVQFWYALDRAAVRAVRQPGVVFRAGQHVLFESDGAHLYMTLPSGRRLTYRDATVEIDPQFGREGVTYWGVDSYTRKWCKQRGYGGLWANNATQGTARDVLAAAWLTVEARSQTQHRPFPDLEVLTSIHDELVCGYRGQTRQGAERALKALCRVLATAPTWAPGLPLAAEGYVARRYRKG